MKLLATLACIATDHSGTRSHHKTDRASCLWNFLNDLWALQQHHRDAVFFADDDFSLVILKPNAADIVDASNMSPKLTFRFILQFCFDYEALTVWAECTLHLSRIPSLKQSITSLTEPRFAVREVSIWELFFRKVAAFKATVAVATFVCEGITAFTVDYVI